MAALRWTAFARTDLDNFWFHIAQGSVNAADQYLSGLEVAAFRYAANPDMGRHEPELTEKFADSIRSFRFRSHRIYYCVRPDEVRIIRVLHARQDRDANM
jgi:plasmid stabilization system protein ParE